MSTATRITIAEYERMIAEGAFEGGLRRLRIELIEGELREMSPIGSPHEMAVAILTEWSFETRLKDRILVWVQNSIVLPAQGSVPEPDLVWAARKDYTTGHPQPSDVVLLIEVADSSVEYDCGEKAELYAGAGIADYWVVNIPNRCVEIFRHPEGGRYQSRQVLTSADEISPLAFPQAKLCVALLFPVS